MLLYCIGFLCQRGSLKTFADIFSFVFRVWSLTVPASTVSTNRESTWTSSGDTPFSGKPSFACFVLVILFNPFNVRLIDDFLFQAVSIPLLASYPYIAMLSGITLHLVINIASVLRNTLSVSAFFLEVLCNFSHFPNVVNWILVSIKLQACKILALSLSCFSPTNNILVCFDFTVKLI